MGTIVGIGGGDMEALETWDIEKRVVELTGRTDPKALFVPTASYDSVERWEVFKGLYGGRLGCRTDVLYLLNRNTGQDELEERILSADIIYVGGGNTLKMMRRWRKLGVDKLLKEAHDRGIVLAGRSAGMICWFKYGHSDSMAFYNPDRWSYVRVKGMGFIDAIGCPHYNGETAGVPRESEFQSMVSRHTELGIAVDNHCAIEFVDDGYRVITSRPDVGAYRVFKGAEGLVVERLEQAGRDLHP
jgi:dipeptidase E